MEENLQKNNKAKFILPILSDIKPVNAEGDFDFKKIEPILNLKNIDIKDEENVIEKEEEVKTIEDLELDFIPKNTQEDLSREKLLEDLERIEESEKIEEIDSKLEEQSKPEINSNSLEEFYFPEVVSEKYSNPYKIKSKEKYSYLKKNT